MKKKLIFNFGFLFLSAIVLLTFPVTFDESITFLAGRNILAGNLPYQDFWSIYAPGQFYLNAAIMSIFGDYVFPLRIFTLVIIYLISFLANKITTKVLDKEVILPGIISYLMLLSVSFFGRSIPTAILIIEVFILMMMRFFENNDKKYLIFSGFIITLLSLFRQDFAVYLVVLIALFFLMDAILHKEREKRFQISALNLSIFYLAFIISLIPIILIIINQYGLNNVYNDLYFLPKTVFPEYRKIDISFFDLNASKSMFYNFSILYNSLANLSIYFIFGSAMNLKLYRKSDKGSIFFLLFFVLYALSLQGNLRRDFEHQIPFLALFLIPMFLDYKVQLSTNMYPKFIKWVGIIFIGFYLTMPLVMIAKNAKNIKSNQFLLSEGKSLKFTPIGKDEFKELTELNILINNLKANKNKIFVCNNINDKIYVNDLILYIYSGKLSSSSIYELHPGYATHQAGQTKIIDDLKKNDNNIIIKKEIPVVEEGNLSSKSSGVFLLDNYIKDNYKYILSLKNYSIFLKK